MIVALSKSTATSLIKGLPGCCPLAGAVSAAKPATSTTASLNAAAFFKNENPHFTLPEAGSFFRNPLTYGDSNARIRYLSNSSVWRTETHGRFGLKAEIHGSHASVRFGSKAVLRDSSVKDRFGRIAVVGVTSLDSRSRATCEFRRRPIDVRYWMKSRRWDVRFGRFPERTIRAVIGRLMHSLTVARRRPSELVDRTLDAVPDGAAVHVAIGQELVGALGRRQHHEHLFLGTQQSLPRGKDC